MGMDDEAAERRERLKALRQAAELSGATVPPADQAEQNGEQENGEQADEAPKIRFRNYVPRDEELLKLKREPPQLPKFEDMIVRSATEDAKTEDPIVSIAPKKPNWDLRRDIANKLDKLEKRTMRAIIELMPEEKENRKREGLEQDDIAS